MVVHKRRATVHDLILAGLPQAEWHYDEDADEMDILLPGSEGRGGVAKRVDEQFYVRIDVDTGEPLTVIIPGFTDWLADKVAEQIRRSKVQVSKDGAVQLQLPVAEQGLFTFTGAIGPKSSASSGDIAGALRHTCRESRELATV